MITRRQAVVGSLFAAGSQIAVGSSVAASSVVKDYPILSAQALRYGLAALLLVAVARRLPRLRREDVPRLILLAATGLAGFNVFLIGAVREGDPGSVGVIVGAVPVALALTAPILRGEAPRPSVVAAAVVVSIGAAAVQWTGDGLSVLAFGLAIGALASEAAFSLVALPLLRRLGPIGTSTYASATAAVMLAAGAVLTDGAGALPAPSGAEIVAIVHLAVIVTAVAFVLWYSSLGLLGVERAGLFAGLIPVAALVTTALIGETAVSPLRLAGAAAVGLGALIGVRASLRVVAGADNAPALAPRVGSVRGRS